MTTKWHIVEAATIVKKGPKKGLEHALKTAYQAWGRKNENEPDAVFVRVPFAPTWNGLPVIADAQISESIVYVGVAR